MPRLDQAELTGCDCGRTLTCSPLLIFANLRPRTVIKDARASQSEAMKTHQATGLPTEVAAMLKLHGLQGSSSIVRLRNWRRYPTGRWEYRIYMEYCSGGDLHSLMEHYWPYKNDRKDTDVSASEGCWIPEPFLCAVFDSLTTAGLLMERGRAGKSPDGLYKG